MGNCLCVTALDANASILVENFTGRYVAHGPGWKWYSPLAKVTYMKKIVLNAQEYLEVTHMRTDNGSVKTHTNGGNCGTSGASTGLTTTPPPENYGALTDGDIIEHIAGPCIYHLDDPYALISQIKAKTELTNTQYMIVTNNKTGIRKTVEGPIVYMPQPYESLQRVTEKITLNNNQYVYITDTSNGHIKTESGPKTFSLTPYERVGEIKNKLNLSMIQYTKILDRNTGIIRVEQGPIVVVLNPYEEVVKDDKGNEIRTAVVVDANNAVLIRDTQTGIERLVTEPQKYIPPPNIQIVEVRPMMKLAPYERMVLIDRESKLFFKSGETENGFFVPPFCNIVSQMWSTDRDRTVKRNTKVERFDVRPHDMDFIFSVRSCDNVEVHLVVNVYWNIESIEKMIKATNDPPQDICNHVRSQILSIASKMTTKELMEYSTADLVKSIYNEDTHFYEARGVKVSRIDILEKKCADVEVEKTYRAIIDQKIARVKNLEKQRGENDTRVAEIEGKILFEKHNNELLQQKMKNMDLENRTQGESEGAKIKMFLDGLGGDMSTAEKVEIFLQLERTKRIDMVTSKVGTLYVTPTEMDLTLNVVKTDNGVSSVPNVSLQLPTTTSGSSVVVAQAPTTSRKVITA